MPTDDFPTSPETLLPNFSSCSPETQHCIETLLDEFRHDVLGLEPSGPRRSAPERRRPPSIESIVDAMSEEDVVFWQRIDLFVRTLADQASFGYKGEPAVLARVPDDWTPDTIALLETEHGTMFAVVCVFKRDDYPHGNSHLLLFHREEEVFCILDGGKLRKTTATDLNGLAKWIECDANQK